MNTIKLNTIGTPFPKAEGGGGDTPSGGGEKRAYITMEAFDAVKNTLNENDSALFEVSLFSFCDFIRTNYGIMSGFFSNSFSPTAMSINLSFRCIAGGFAQTFEEALKDTPEGVRAAWETMPKITEEEFYNLA